MLSYDFKTLKQPSVTPVTAINLQTKSSFYDDFEGIVQFPLPPLKKTISVITTYFTRYIIYIIRNQCTTKQLYEIIT